MTEKAGFICLLKEKLVKKQTKMIRDQGKNKIGAIMKQKERQLDASHNDKNNLLLKQ